MLRPRRLQIPGSNLKNVCVLHTPADANKIARLATGNRLVIVGASFIGTKPTGWARESEVRRAAPVFCRSWVRQEAQPDQTRPALPSFPCHQQCLLGPYQYLLQEDLFSCSLFAGMEVAAYMSDKAASINVIERQAFPYQEALGDKVGGVAMKVGNLASARWGGLG